MSTEHEALRAAIDALEEIALAGMSGSGQESEEGMRDWHARRAWEFIGIAARALEPAREGLRAAQAAAVKVPTAWMDPKTLDVIHAERKASWESDYGIGGKGKAAAYTVPLVAAAAANTPTPTPGDVK